MCAVVVAHGGSEVGFDGAFVSSVFEYVEAYSEFFGESFEVDFGYCCAVECDVALRGDEYGVGGGGDVEGFVGGYGLVEVVYWFAGCGAEVVYEVSECSDVGHVDCGGGAFDVECGDVGVLCGDVEFAG